MRNVSFSERLRGARRPSGFLPRWIPQKYRTRCTHKFSQQNAIQSCIILRSSLQATINWRLLFDEDQTDLGAPSSNQTCSDDDLGTRFELYRAGEVPPSENVERFYWRYRHHRCRLNEISVWVLNILIGKDPVPRSSHTVDDICILTPGSIP